MESKKEELKKEELKKEENKLDKLNVVPPQSIEEYIVQAPLKAQEKLREIRSIIQEAAPKAKEKISWSMPTYDYYGNLVHFAAHKNHIGFYPADTGIRAFEERLREYKSSKGAVQFPYDQALPAELIKDIVLYRLTENEEYEKEKKSKKSNKSKGKN